MRTILLFAFCSSFGCDAPELATQPAARRGDALTAVAPDAPSKRETKKRSFVDVLAEAEWAGLVTVVGREVRTAPWGSAGRNVLVTDWSVRTERMAFGQSPGDVVTLMLPGGHTADGRGVSVSGVPQLEMGQRLIVIIDPQRAGHSWVGAAQGLLSVDEQDKVTLRGRPVIAIDAAGFQVGPAPRTAAAALTADGDSRVGHIVAEEALGLDEALAALRHLAGGAR